MSAQSSEQFDPSTGWRFAEGFLHLHGRSPDGDELLPALIQALMIGVWAGCRFALVDHDLALAIAALGNAQTSLAFETMQRGFAVEFGKGTEEVVQHVLYERGFTYGWAELFRTVPDALTSSDAIEEAQDVLRKGRAQNPDGGEGSEE
jgi:hypothetical protein